MHATPSTESWRTYLARAGFDFARSFDSIEGRRSSLEPREALDLGALDPTNVLDAARWLEARGLERPHWVSAVDEPVHVLERERADGTFEAVELDDHEVLRDGVRFRIPREHGVYRVSTWWSAVYVQRSESVGLWGERESARVPFLPPAAGGAVLEGVVRGVDGEARGGAVVWLASAVDAPRANAVLSAGDGSFRSGPINVREVVLACECVEGTAELRVDAALGARVELRLGAR